MLTEDGKHLYVSYDEYHNLIEKLALKVYQSGWEFDTILCLARGGMRPGDIGMGNMVDVAFSAVEALGLAAVNIKANHPIADFGKTQDERQTDITQPDDTDHRAFFFQLFDESLLHL